MDFLTPHYDALRVATSVLIAAFASFVTLDLARRVRGDDQSVALESLERLAHWSAAESQLPGQALIQMCRQTRS